MKLIRLFFATSLAYGNSCAPTIQTESGLIEVIVKDSLGNRINDAKVTISEVGSGRRIDLQKPILYGSYDVQIFRPAFKTIERYVNLYQPKLIVRAELEISMECGGFESIHGRVQSVPIGRELFVKVVPIWEWAVVSRKLALTGTSSSADSILAITY